MIEEVKKHGKVYYRLGKEGKLYPTLKKAQRQERVTNANRKKLNGTENSIRNNSTS